jgi:glycolate oxidase FAD binding subunit
MPDVPHLLEELTALLGPDALETGAATDAYAVDDKTPWAIVSPGTVAQVAGVLALAQREGLAVMPWGGGTSMGLGRPPERIDVALRLHRLDQVLEHQPGDLTATAQAGIALDQLQQQLGRAGQWWTVAPPWPAFATLGGVLAANASGPKRLLYGTARDTVIGMQVVHADGSISKAGGKVPKNVTGYDMLKLYINSLGTLGVIVEATLKLRPVPPVQQVAWATFPSLEAGSRAAQQLLASELLPNAVELVNPPLAMGLGQTLGEAGPAGDWSLLVGVDGVEQAVTRQLRQLQAICHSAGAKEWWTGLDDGRLWAALQTRLRPRGDEAQRQVVFRIGTVQTRAYGLLQPLQTLAARFDGAWEIAARPGSGLVYGSVPAEASAASTTLLAQALAELRAQVEESRGYVVIESAPLPFKAQLDSWGEPGPPFEVMRALKRAFDPQRVLNPGRFVGGL